VRELQKTISPEEREYVRYLSEIEVRKRQVIELQTELAVYKEHLGRFSAEYHARVGTLFIELDRIGLSIVEYQFRLSQLRENPQSDLAKLERESKRQFTEQREQIYEDEEETRYYEREHQDEQKRPELNDASELSLKSLYRELAKRFHPDLAKTADERQQREAVMKEVNAAFHKRDICQMRTIGDQHHIDDAEFEEKSIGERLVWAIREVSRLDNLIEAIRSQKASLEAGELGILWTREESGENVVNHLETDLNVKIERSRARLQLLITELRELMDGVHRDRKA